MAQDKILKDLLGGIILLRNFLLYLLMILEGDPHPWWPLDGPPSNLILLSNYSTGFISIFWKFRGEKSAIQIYW